MLKLKLKDVRLSGFMGLALAVAMPVAAQEQLRAPRGWNKSVAAGNVVFSQTEDRLRIVIKKLAPLQGSARNWFEGQVEQDGRARGVATSPGNLGGKNEVMTWLRSYRSASGPQSVVYMGYPVGNQGRILILSGPDSQTLLPNMEDFRSVALETKRLDDERARRGGTGTNRVVRNQSSQTKRKVATTQSRPVGVKLSPVAAKGTLKSSQIVGIFLDESYNVGVGGSMIIEYNPVLLLRDGSARRYLEVPPQDVNLAQDKAAHAKDWGRWTRSGAKIKVRWSAKDSDELETKYKVRPATPGQTLERRYSTLGGGGNTAMGGDVMVFYSNAYNFARNGTFASEASGGGGNSGVTAVSNRKNAGRYRLDGYALTLKYNDGRQVRRLFYFYPNDNKADVVGIGDSSYIGDD